MNYLSVFVLLTMIVWSVQAMEEEQEPQVQSPMQSSRDIQSKDLLSDMPVYLPIDKKMEGFPSSRGWNLLRDRKEFFGIRSSSFEFPRKPSIGPRVDEKTPCTFFDLVELPLGHKFFQENTGTVEEDGRLNPAAISFFLRSLYPDIRVLHEPLILEKNQTGSSTEQVVSVGWKNRKDEVKYPFIFRVLKNGVDETAEMRCLMDIQNQNPKMDDFRRKHFGKQGYPRITLLESRANTDLDVAHLGLGHYRAYINKQLKDFYFQVLHKAPGKSLNKVIGSISAIEKKYILKSVGCSFALFHNDLAHGDFSVQNVVVQKNNKGLTVSLVDNGDLQEASWLEEDDRRLCDFMRFWAYPLVSTLADGSSEKDTQEFCSFLEGYMDAYKKYVENKKLFPIFTQIFKEQVQFFFKELYTISSWGEMKNLQSLIEETPDKEKRRLIKKKLIFHINKHVSQSEFWDQPYWRTAIMSVARENIFKWALKLDLQDIKSAEACWNFYCPDF